MDSTSDRSRYVVLRAGLTMPVEPLQLLWTLADRGVRLSRSPEAADRLHVEPASVLTPEDLVAVRRWKQHLLVLLDYADRNDLDGHLRGVQ